MTYAVENKIQELENRIKALEELIFSTNKPNPDPSYWQLPKTVPLCSVDAVSGRFNGQIDLRDDEK